jgi:hypothetical protein
LPAPRARCLGHGRSRSLARHIPAIEKVVASPAGERLVREFARAAVVAAVRSVIEDIRASIRSPLADEPPRRT